MNMLMMDTRPSLTMQELDELSPLFAASFKSLISFDNYTLYFPDTLPRGMEPKEPSGPLEPVYLPEEKSVLLPLVLADQGVAVFMAQGVSLRAPKSMLPLLARAADMALANVGLYKRSISDFLTGLFSRDHLLACLRDELCAIRRCIGAGSGPGAVDNGDCESRWKASAGVVVIAFPSMRDGAARMGFSQCDGYLSDAAALIAGQLDEQALAARWQDDTLAVLLPGATRTVCRTQAAALAGLLKDLRRTHAATGQAIHFPASIGLAAFPQSLHGPLLELDEEEQARVLMDKAVRAAACAAELGADEPMAPSDVLRKGGLVRELLPMHRVRLSLGRLDKVRDGDRFLVLEKDGDDARHRAEIHVLETEDHHSLGEIVSLADVAEPVSAGDRLRLISDSGQAPEGGNGTAVSRSDEIHEDSLFPPYKTFLAEWARQREECERFTLALVRMDPMPEGASGKGQMAWAAGRDMERLFRDTLRQSFGPDVLAGRFSNNSVLVFHPDLDGREAERRYQECNRYLAETTSMQVATGLAPYPFLDGKRSDSVENCRKSLAYAALLPFPHVGLLDSVALTISADRLFSQGDLYAAVEEYKKALCADASNALARNSLGICYARLGRNQDGMRELEQVLARSPRDAMALYNLGHLLQKEGDIQEARVLYRRCLRAHPGHVYSLLRLGQLCEMEDRIGQAGRYYQQAAASKEGAVVARRSLARVRLAQNRVQEARELLQEALRINPNDAGSLTMLARIYSDSGEDFELAELYARQGVALSPLRRASWLELGRVYKARGKEREARDVLARAAGL